MKKRFCPKCKSENVSIPVLKAFLAFSGLNPGWRCDDCGLELQEFPMKEITKKIAKINKK